MVWGVGAEWVFAVHGVCSEGVCVEANGVYCACTDTCVAAVYKVMRLSPLCVTVTGVSLHRSHHVTACVVIH